MDSGRYRLTRISPTRHESDAPWVGAQTGAWLYSRMGKQPGKPASAKGSGSTAEANTSQGEGRATTRAAPGRALRLRIALEQGVELGPGKADLLEAIRETGSIAAAGRRMRMSYQRAWDLVAALNTGFGEPLVEAVKGGARGGGAVLTPLGEGVLAAYRRIEDAAEAAAEPQLAWLRQAQRTPARPRQRKK